MLSQLQTEHENGIKIISKFAMFHMGSTANSTTADSTDKAKDMKSSSMTYTVTFSDFRRGIGTSQVSQMGHYIANGRYNYIRISLLIPI